MNKAEMADQASHGRIIMVEDDNDFRESLMKYLKMNGYDIIGVGTAMEFYQHIAAEKYMIAIVDIGLSDQSGLVLGEFVRKNTDMRIIMLTARASVDDKLAGYTSGADIYLVKPVDFREVIAAISTILERLNGDPSQLLRRDEEHALLPEKKNPWKLVRSQWLLLAPEGEEIRLTSKEFEFLFCVASNHQRVAKRKEIFHAMCYKEDDSRCAAIEALVHRLRRKTEINGATSPIKTIHGVGYRFTADIVIE